MPYSAQQISRYSPGELYIESLMCLTKGSVRNNWSEGGGGGAPIFVHTRSLKKIDPPLTLGKKIVTLPKIIQKNMTLPYKSNSHFC